MPSGAKKRKAAKKKKEKETESNNNPSTTNSQRNDEVKSQDENGSDGGSPSHGEYDHTFNEEEEKRDPSAVQQSYAAFSKGLEEVPGNSKIDESEGGKEGVVVIEWDMKSEGSESKDVSVGHAESAKESYYGNGNSSSSSDEAETVKNGKDEFHNSIKETLVIDELVKSMDTLKTKMTTITQKVPAEEIIPNVLVEDITQNVPIEETCDSGAESSADPVKAVASIPEVQSNDNANALSEKRVGSQVEAIDLHVKENEDKEYSFSDQNVRTINLEESKPREFDNEVSTSVSYSTIPESTIAAEHVKDSDTPECSENQPLVASAPPLVQKTSWLSCCGLFDVLLSSNR